MKTLDVYLLNDLVGKLKQGKSGELSFSYSKNWLNSDQSKPLSHSLPLQQNAFSQKECVGFFNGILPEELSRKIIAKNLGISYRNDYAMLSAIGGECAGAVTFIAENKEISTDNIQYKEVSSKELSTIIKDLPLRPMMAGEDGIRLSLAGAQDKLSIHISNTGFGIPIDSAPSTHILKPAISRLEDTVQNEALCMKLAKLIGLPTADVEVLKIKDTEVLAVKRYDRELVEGGTVKRLHQEDFCQALGIISELKYQNEGGVSIKQSFDLLRASSAVPVIDLMNLLDGIIYNFLIGNNDAHGKNFSLLYENNQTRLAPFYDLLCTVYYPNLAQKMAMKIGNKYHPDFVYPRHFEQFSKEAGLSKPLVLERIVKIGDEILTKLPELRDELPESAKIIDFIRAYTTNTLKRFKR
jgi:serine/threonine-protein kinase HipA